MSEERAVRGADHMTTVAFDVIGTLFDLERPRAALSQVGLPTGSLELWFAQSLRDAFALSHAGSYRPLADVLEAGLRRLVASTGVRASEEGLGSVMSAFSELDPRPDAPGACRRLANEGVRLLALTNGSERSTRAMLRNAGILDLFSDLLSCDRIRTSKPDPRVYQMAKARARGELWLVAAHAWDVAGATFAGLRTVWVSSVEATYLSAYPLPDVEADDLGQAAGAILDRHR
ncbi:MAG TPA: haloacid dehalogenase type II [Actinomycetota bacterium]|nr:haloacid dehalogenase type II [Actinomycetota bacterium]